MHDATESVTVFRSLDPAAESDAARVRELLSGAGLDAVVFDDNTPGVVEGTFEVRVPASQAEQAERLIAAGDAEMQQASGDTSESLDLETVFQADGASPTAEMEAMEVSSLLTAAGIDTVTIGSSTLPNLPFEVRVPRDDAERARLVIAEARAAGPAAAEQAERELEEGSAAQ